MTLESRRFGWTFGLARSLFAGALFVATSTPSAVLVQSSYDPWAEPLNLSRSGIATNPGFVIDSDGVGHVVWQDDLANYVYTWFDGDQWSTPEMTDLDLLFRLPIASESTSRSELAAYTGPNPLFIAGRDQYVFAFWISPEGRLFTSRVQNLSFEHVAAWESAQLITPGATTFAAAIDAGGELHLTFLRMSDDAAHSPGIYYTRSNNSGRDWAVPVLLYESPYLRRLGDGEANLSLATAGTMDTLRVYVAWDNRVRKQVLLAKSAAGGVSWEAPDLIAGPAPNSGVTGPFNIHVGTYQSSVVLVWQSGRPGGACSQIYQYSKDKGATWSDPRPMIENLLGCAESNDFVKGLANSSEGLLFLTKTKSQVFLTAWNGIQWSEPQVEPILSGFEDPEIYTEVLYGCHQASLLADRLYIVGCDQGEGGDVWVTSRDLGSNTSLFSSPIWSQPSPVTDDNLEMETIELVATDDDLIHAFFSQHQDPTIYYTFWDGQVWSRIIPVLELPEGEAAWPTIAAGPGNELILIAQSSGGTLYFSRATSGNAATQSRWSTPRRVGIGHDGQIGSVDITRDAAGTIFVVYSVPVNEERGIYLIQSKDGTFWSEPLQVFNGAAAGFDLVGAPSLLTSENSVLHIIWKQQSISGDGVSRPLSLYYSRSEDSGRTFSNAELIVDEPVTWRQIAADDKGNLHLFWQPQDMLTTVWDQISFDDGRSWQFPQGLSDEGITAAIMVDTVGRLHLVHAGQDSLDHWLWNGSRWKTEPPLHWSLASQQEGPVNLLAAAVNKQGKMVVVMAVPAVAGTLEERILFYSSRTLDLPRRQATPEAPTQTLLPPTLIPATPTPQHSSSPTNTIDRVPTNSQGQTDQNNADNRLSPLTVALLPVALLLVIVLSIVIRRASRVEDR